MMNLILQLLENDALKTTFLKLMNMSISASWLVLAVFVLRFALRKAPKWFDVLLWGFVAVRLICPFSIESALSLIPSTETIPMNIEMAARPAIDSGIDAVNSAVNPMIAASFTPNPGASANPLQIWIPAASGIWLLGMLLMMLYTVISYFSLYRKLDTAVRYEKNIFQSENVTTPFVLGVFKPRIYLPFQIPEADLTYVVAHEQAHICRKDHWWKPLGFLLLTVHWFNPLMWLAYILLCRDIELACDEKVIQKLGSEQRAEYTQALVSCSVNRRMVAACPLAFGEVGVKDRVKTIMNYKKPTFWLVVAAMIFCIVLAVCFLTDPIQDKHSQSFLHYKNAISLSERQDVIPTIHYTSVNDFHGSIGMGMVEGKAFAAYLDTVQWTEKLLAPGDLSSPGSVAVNVAENLRITIYDRKFAAVKFNDEVCYYRIKNGDYESILQLLIPVDEDRLERSSETRLDVVLGVAAVEDKSERILLDDIISAIEYDEITEITLRNLHNGSWSHITDEMEVESVLHFLSKVEGINKTSSKGYYGGCYTIQLQDSDETIFSIGFGDDESFHYGDYGDGYPARYDLRGVTREDVIRFLSRYDTSGLDWGLSSSVLHATVLEIHDGYFLVEPVEGSWELASSDRIKIPMKNMEPSPEPKVGDILEIEYDGQLQETYPARISNPYSIKIAESTGRLSLNDVIILSQKGHELTWSDFDQFEYMETGFGLYIRVYEINDMFRLMIGGNHPEGYPDKDPMYIYLTLVEDKEIKIDIRDGGVTEFISEHNSDSREKWDRIPMVMVNGTLYLDTGKESTVMARCGMMDGEITSQVPGNEEPTIDNQSNFGTGYGYQYGAMEGTIEIHMNGKWWVFATEEARQKIQFPEHDDEGKRTLTQEEIDRVNEAFSPIRFNAQGEPRGTNILSCFFTSYYDDICDMNFAEFLAYFPGDGSAVEETEFARLKDLEDFLFYGYVSVMEDMPVPVHKHRVKNINLTLQKFAGITVENLDTSDVNYLPEYDAFYNYTSDYAPGIFQCTRGEIDGNIVRLYEESDTGTDVLTLRKTGNSYLIAAHQQFAN